MFASLHRRWAREVVLLAIIIPFNQMIIRASVFTLGLTASLGLTAQTIVKYDFNTDLGASFEDPALSASVITVGAGLKDVAFNNAGRSGASNSLYVAADDTDGILELGLAIEANEYFAFEIDVDPGSAMDLTSLTFELGYTAVGTFVGKEFTAYLLSSIGGFTADKSLGDGTVLVTDLNSGSSPQYPSAPTFIDLSGVQFDNVTTAVEFRLYITDNTGNANYLGRIDDITLNGTVTDIPEHSACALFGGLLACGCVMLRRR